VAAFDATCGLMRPLSRSRERVAARLRAAGEGGEAGDHMRVPHGRGAPNVVARPEHHGTRAAHAGYRPDQSAKT